MLEIDKPLRKEGVLLEKLEDECLLYDGDLKKIHILNLVAGFVWQLCDGEHSVLDMEKEIRRHFEVSGEVMLKDDLLSVIREFADLELVSFPSH